MIAFLTGRVAEKAASYVVLDVGGVGYRIAMSTGSLASLPATGDSVTVHTHLHVREDEMSLFGFESPSERALFERLITVSGVGPKVALAALSSFAPDALIDAIGHEDVATLSSIPGVGKKTAQRMIIDLKDRLGILDLVEARPGAGMDATNEARDALLGMGFSPQEVALALKGFEGPADTQAMLRHALRRLGGGA